MMSISFWSAFLLWGTAHIAAPGQAAGAWPQPEEGPGSTALYTYEEVRFSDFAADEDGYWLFEPLGVPGAERASVVVFHHGYGAINPAIYGGWIRHLVRQGHIVIYPRYQNNLLFPAPSSFVAHAATGIKRALAELETGEGRVRPDTSKLFIAGHSYGGAIAANIAARYRELGLPRPRAALLCAPGTGPLSGGLLETYAGMDSGLRLGIVVSADDYVVGEELGRKVYATATNTPNRFLVRQSADRHGAPEVTAGHNECYALDTAFDAGLHNVSYKRALSIARTDVVDYKVYWKLLDALIACELQGSHCDMACGQAPGFASLGYWPDGKPVQPLETWLP